MIIFQDRTINDISDIDIYKFYLKDIKIGINLSPFRKENHPSFSLFYSGDVLLWKDWGLNESGNSVKFVMKLFGLSYRAAVKKIELDLSGLSSFIGLPNKLSQDKKSVNIKIRIKDFTKQDLNYWNKYGITKEILNKFNIYSISHYWLDNRLFYIHTNKLAYAYTRKINNNMYVYKLYFPDSIYHWFSNNIKYIQGYDQLPNKENLLIITKSLKDIMVYYSLRYYAISPNSESSNIEQSLISDLNNRFNRVFINYDNDIVGLRFAKKISNQYNLESFIVPEISGIKDISDYREKYGEQKTKEFLSLKLTLNSINTINTINI